ncbi:MAG: site-2 protease family protein [Candidatus Levybacteria bacterium]|nr:site-2 protease family protein [Candidatus Levybacteria bacterium]
MLLTALVFLIILSVLVLIHELGHFLVAKKLNIKVEEFGFGFPPRLFGIKRGETIYSINWLPIGGFVKLYGEDDAGGGTVKLKIKNEKLKMKELHRAFFVRSVGQRAAVVVAGVVMNTFLAIIIFYVFLFVSGFKTELPLLTDHKFIGVTRSNKTDIIVTSVQKDSPAQKAGIPIYGKIISINDQAIGSSENFITTVKKYQGKTIKIAWLDPKTQKKVVAQLVPRLNPPKGQGAVGVSLYGIKTAILDYQTTGQRFFSGISHPFNLIVYNVELMKNLVASAVREKDASQLGEGFAGPVGIYSLVGTIVQIPDLKERVLQLLNLAGLLSMSLAVFNILPIPALDGGRLFFILIEGIFRKKVSVRFETLAHTIGMIVLLGLIVVITFNDIFRFILNR